MFLSLQKHCQRSCFIFPFSPLNILQHASKICSRCRTILMLISIEGFEWRIFILWVTQQICETVNYVHSKSERWACALLIRNMCTIIQRDCFNIVRLVQSVATTKELMNTSTHVREQFLMSDGKVFFFLNLSTENGPISHPSFHETYRVPLRFTNIHWTALQISYKT